MIDEKTRTYNRIYARKRRKSKLKFEPKQEKQYNSSKERFRMIRLEALGHYSGIPPKCACCGETEVKFLSIDHINGGGNEHRRSYTKNGKGGNISWWLKKNNYPPGFQVLCHNCNMAKGFYGSCPHQTKVV